MGSVGSDANGTPRWAGAVIGVLTAGVALGVAHLAAAILEPASSPVLAVGDVVVDATPEWLTAFAIRTFGTADKPVLLAGIAIVIAVVAAVLGVVAVRRPWAPVVGIAVLAVVGIAAAVTRPGAGPGAAAASVAGALAGAGAYVRLRAAAGLPPLRPPDGPVDGSSPVLDRRRFLWTGVAAAGVAVVADRSGAWLSARSGASASRASVTIPPASDRGRPTPDAASLGIAGVAPFITPNADFYRVDTALFVPSLAASSWRLDVRGMVDRPLTLTYEELLARPLIERDVTLACVSNEVGGGYVGNARWVGAPLADLLDEAGVRVGADQVVSRSSDGFTAGTPTAAITDGRDAMLAVAMNGEPLPLEHGFPVRMLVPGLYGYVSATKWLVDLELTTFAAYDPYWIERGWAERAPILTQARIDTPTSGADLDRGPIAIAGVAWAQGRGIVAVEVAIDDGPWGPATLGAEDTIDTWRQWRFDWDAVPGSHVLAVRATDGTGEVQTAEVRPPFPSGATGHHRVTVTVT